MTEAQQHEVSQIIFALTQAADDLAAAVKDPIKAQYLTEHWRYIEAGYAVLTMAFNLLKTEQRTAA